LAWRLHEWWIIVVGIAFSWIVDEIIKAIIIAFLPDSFLRDENLLNYLWGLNPFHITISSTKMITRREEWDKTTKNYKSDYKLGENDGLENSQEAKFFGEKVSAIFIYPPRPWQTVVEEFENIKNV
jgi:hypothetical protein